MRVLFSAATIAGRVRELASEATDLFDPHRPICAVVVLKGANVFAADLLRCIDRDISVEFIRAESYRGTSGGDVALGELPAVTGQQVLVVEDIIERGETLARVVTALRAEGAERVLSVALLQKPGQLAREIPCPVVRGFDIGPEFVVGYGMDLDGHYRHLPDVCVVDG